MLVIVLGIVLWGLKSECILGASVFRFRDSVRDSTLGAKKRYIFWDVMKNVLGIGIGLGLVIVLGIDNQS